MRTGHFSTRGSVLALSLAIAGCGSNASTPTQESSAQLVQLCASICSKSAQCSDAGPAASACNAACADASAADFGPGCNVNQLVSTEDACLADSCSTFASCIETAAATAACATSGEGSTSAEAGASCALCDQAGTCCAALQSLFGATDAGSCAAFTTAACNDAGPQSPGFADECQLQLTVGQDYGVAACN